LFANSLRLFTKKSVLRNTINASSDTPAYKSKYRGRFMKEILISLLLVFSVVSNVWPQGLGIGSHEFYVGKVRLWYRVAGRKKGVPVVFLHGGPGEGSQAFQAVGGPKLEKTQRLVYFDQRGAGRSDRPKDTASYSLNILVEDIERLRLQLGVPKIVLLGHSFGTQLSLEYAAKYPQNTAAVVLAAAMPHLARSLDIQCERLEQQDPPAYARAADGVPLGTVPRCNSMRAYTGAAAQAFALRNLFPDPVIGEKVEALDNANGLRNSGEAAGALFQQGLLTYQFKEAAKVLAPVLVIAGGMDYQAAIEPQRDLVNALRRGRLLVYPSMGHFMFVEDPNLFARDVTAFLKASAKNAASQ
jgi:proline iminopeptidase